MDYGGKYVCVLCRCSAGVRVFAENRFRAQRYVIRASSRSLSSIFPSVAPPLAFIPTNRWTVGRVFPSASAIIVWNRPPKTNCRIFLFFRLLSSQYHFLIAREGRRDTFHRTGQSKYEITTGKPSAQPPGLLTQKKPAKKQNRNKPATLT